MQTMIIASILALFGGLAKAHACSQPIVAVIEQVSAEYALDPALLLSIAKTESSCRPGAINQKTHDYGLMQINRKTAAAYGYTPAQIMQIKTNVRLSAKVLVYMRKRFGTEKHWYCRYNVGTAKSAPMWATCAKYAAKLAQHGYEVQAVVDRN